MADILYSVRQLHNYYYVNKYNILPIARDDNRNGGIYDDSYNQRFSVGTNTIKVSLSSPVIRGWAGQTIAIPLNVTDELGNPAGALTHFNLNSSVLNLEVSFQIFDSWFISSVIFNFCTSLHIQLL